MSFDLAPPPVIVSDAGFSACGKLRYWLRRTWEPDLARVVFCGANPSTAGATEDDHTIRKEMGFAREWGYGGLIKLNLLHYVSTDPKAVPNSFFATGGDANDYAWSNALTDSRVDAVVAAWGDCLERFTWGASRAERFLEAAARADQTVYCLGTTKAGNPKHPLRLAYSTERRSFRIPAETRHLSRGAAS